MNPCQGLGGGSLPLVTAEALIIAIMVDAYLFTVLTALTAFPVGTPVNNIPDSSSGRKGVFETLKRGSNP
jgi:hypothetical protein